MNNKEWKNPYAVKTAFDLHEEECKKVIDETKFVKRAEIKPMAKIRDTEESHVSSRNTHMKQAADIAKIMAQKLGLNETVSYIGMLMHDAGHPFGAHEGEMTLHLIGILLNTGFFHHNAKGVDTVLSEDIINKFIKAIPEAKNNLELKKQLEDDVWYFFDIIVGHDGEATAKDKEKQEKFKKYNSIKEAVLAKVSRANRQNEYKCSVETLEGNLSKPSDVIAYLKSDMLDAFEQKIIYKFSDEYLEDIGELLFEKEEQTKELNKDENEIKKERIAKAKNLIKEIKFEKLRETQEDIVNPEGQEILNVVKEIIDKLEKDGIDTYCVDNEDKKTKSKIKETVEYYIEKYKIDKFDDELFDENTVQSQVHKIIDYTQKMLKVRQSVVEDVMTRVQTELIDDYCENCKKNIEDIEKLDDTEENKKQMIKSKMDFSDRVSNILYKHNGFKDLNYKEYVQFTKKEYQTKELPKAVFKTIDQCANALLKLGLIRDKFYDKSILSLISNENIKKSMKIKNVNEREYNKYKAKIGINELGINELKNIRKPKVVKTIKKYKDKLPNKNTYRKKIFKGIYGFAQRQGSRFARTCEDVYYAIPYTVADLVKKAISPNYEVNQYLPEEEKQRVYNIRKELKDRYGEYNGEAISVENIRKYIDEKVKMERTENFPKNVATEIAIKYIGGMTDTRIKRVVRKMGNASMVLMKKQDKPSKDKNQSVTRLINEYGGAKKENPEEFRQRIKSQKVKPLQCYGTYDENEPLQGFVSTDFER